MSTAPAASYSCNDGASVLQTAGPNISGVRDAWRPRWRQTTDHVETELDESKGTVCGIHST